MGLVCNKFKYQFCVDKNQSIWPTEIKNKKTHLHFVALATSGGHLISVMDYILLVIIEAYHSVKWV